MKFEWLISESDKYKYLINNEIPCLRHRLSTSLPGEPVEYELLAFGKYGHIHRYSQDKLIVTIYGKHAKLVRYVTGYLGKPSPKRVYKDAEYDFLVDSKLGTVFKELLKIPNSRRAQLKYAKQLSSVYYKTP